TFLPTFASTAANTEPEAPAPTMTTSTFSFAMSPPLGRRDVGHVGNAEIGIAIHGAVDDIDGIAAQDEIDERRWRALALIDLVLAHIADEAALLLLAKLRKTAALELLARAVDGTNCRPIEVRVRGPHVEDARFKQRLLGRDGNLLIDEMRDAGLAGAGNECLAQCIQRLRLRSAQGAQWHALRASRPRREQEFSVAHREGERPGCRAFQQGASFDVVHAFLPGAAPSFRAVGGV